MHRNPSAPATPRHSTILLVEDEPTIAITLRDDLTDHGYLVTSTGDGAEALQLLKRQRFHAVVTDLRLPGADGVEIVSAARRTSPGTRILVVTAFAANRAEALYAAGAREVLHKPFANQAVLAWLAQAAS
ncbi:MAG: response regulator [Planctomycetes bacterium]|nr:response regulator [Planctomycetota bacterium]MCC7065754.1 response regulator [Planctomycetota bacterium]